MATKKRKHDEVAAVHGGGVVVFRRQHEDPLLVEFLVLHARWGERGWSVPKGHKNRGESALAAALRETGEETGISAEKIRVVPGFEELVEYRLHRKTKKCPTGVKRVRLFLGEVDHDTAVVLSKEHTEYLWIKAAGAKQLLPTPFSVSIDKAIQVLRGAANGEEANQKQPETNHQ